MKRILANASLIRLILTSVFLNDLKMYQNRRTS